MSDDHSPAPNSPPCVEGGCHCGAVRFRAALPASPVLDECNCSICTKSGYLHLIVAGSDFELLAGQDSLAEYRFGSGRARHLFCRHCGIKSFYVPRSHPTGYSINARCLDSELWRAFPVRLFDGRHWERAMTDTFGTAAEDGNAIRQAD